MLVLSRRRPLPAAAIRRLRPTRFNEDVSALLLEVGPPAGAFRGEPTTPCRPRFALKEIAAGPDSTPMCLHGFH
jgi:hypothetical protein